MFEIHTLGGLWLRKDGVTLDDLGSRKAEAILVYTAVAGRPQKRNLLASLLWPESPENQALTSLRVALSALRKDVGEYVDITRESLGLKPGAPVYLDVAELEEQLAVGQIEPALDIYRGDFLLGFNLQDSLEFEDWRRLQQERLHRQVASALQVEISRAIEEEEYKKGETFIHRLLELDPLDEFAHRQYMLLLGLSEQRVAALAQYEKCRDLLQSELGVEPSPETQELYELISQGQRPVSTRSLTPANNLPIYQTSFIGREREVGQITTFLCDPACRLLTLVGPGGIGKTRLSVQAAGKVLHTFRDGVFFVPSEPIASPEYLAPGIASAIQFKVDEATLDQLDFKSQLLGYIGNRSLLLVLDGYEHLISGAGLLADLLAHSPNVKLLVTSRQKLDLHGEWIYPLEGLPVEKTPKGHSPAVRLLNERARQANTTFQLSENELEPAVQLCHLVEGMPLGIELAAAWTSLLSLSEIIEQILKNLDFLTTSAQDVSERHRSLRAVFDSSFAMLTEEQRAAYSQLTVFEGGFDWHAALPVAGINLSQLSALKDKSMLMRDNSGRFFQHRLLQQYAQEKLAVTPSLLTEVHGKHCSYYIDFLLQRDGDLNGPQIIKIQVEILREIENIRAAVKWAVTHWESNAVREVFSTYLIYFAGWNWQEGKDAFRELARTRKEFILSLDLGLLEEDPVYHSARAHQAYLMCNLGQTDECDVLSRECLQPLQALGLKAEVSMCLHNLGANASFRGEYETGKELLEQAVLFGSESNHDIWKYYLLWLGYAYFLLGEYEQGIECYQKCYEMCERTQNPWGKAYALSKMGMAADGLGDHDRAIYYQRQALTVFEKMGNKAGKAYALSRISMSAYFLEEYTQAVQYGQEGYQLYIELGHRWGICTSMCRVGFAWLGVGNVAEAKSSFYKALEHSREFRLLPQILYSLAGLSAALSQEGDAKAALDLLDYVQRHPRTPSIYVDQARRWFVQPPDFRAREISGETKIEDIEEVNALIERLLKIK